jgi:tetratricopeptide (TPR) repeat protein
MSPGSLAPTDELTIGQVLNLAVEFERQDRIADAERLYLVVLAKLPNNFDGLHRLGVVRSRQDRLDEAAGLMRRALRQKPDSAHAHNNLANVLAALRRPDEAIRHYRRAISIIPDLADAHNNLAAALAAAGQLDEAEKHYLLALRYRPDYAEAHNNIGALLHKLGRGEGGVVHFERAIAIKPDYPSALNNLGIALLGLDRAREALGHCRKAIALDDGFAEAHHGAGRALLRLGQPADAIVHFEKAIAIDANFAAAHGGAGNALLRLGRHGNAVQHFSEAVALRPTFAEAHNNLGGAFDALERSDEALASFRKAAELDPKFAEPLGNMGALLSRLGRFGEAKAAYERALELSPRNVAFLFGLGELKDFAAGDPELVTMEQLLDDPGVARDQLVPLHFALARAYDKLRDHARSAHHVTEGARLKRKQISYDERAMLGSFRNMKARATPEVMRRHRHCGHPSSVPVFIVGMPRSGSTLVEQLLASHPDVFGAGELRDFPLSVEAVLKNVDGPKHFASYEHDITAERLREIAGRYLDSVLRRAPGAIRITDKLPGNFTVAGLIHMALPNARIIHTRRDPVATCFSCYSILFKDGLDFTYDLRELGRFYNAYEDMMDHWRGVLPNGVMIDVQYETLVSDFETEARRIVDHCGLPWHPACLAFHETPREVRTASSAQVRKPLYATAVERWRPYAQMLQPLLDELAKPR